MIISSRGVRMMFLPVALALVVACQTRQGHAQPHNLLGNGGFETVAADQKGPQGWDATILPRTSGVVAFGWDNQIAHSGTRSVSVSIQAAHPDEKVAYNWTRTVPQCEPGETYELRAWIRTKGLTTPAFVAIQCWDSAKTNMLGFATTQEKYPLKGTTDWTQVHTTFSVPDKAGEVRVRAGISAPENRGGKVWFDDICITQVSR